MTTLKLTNLVLRCSNHNPYTGKLSKKDNLIGAIELATLLKKFSDDGQHQEAMNIESSEWSKVLQKLETKLLKIKE